MRGKGRGQNSAHTKGGPDFVSDRHGYQGYTDVVNLGDSGTVHFMAPRGRGRGRGTSMNIFPQPVQYFQPSLGRGNGSLGRGVSVYVS